MTFSVEGYGNLRTPETFSREKVYLCISPSDFSTVKNIETSSAAGAIPRHICHGIHIGLAFVRLAAEFQQLMFCTYGNHDRFIIL